MGRDLDYEICIPCVVQWSVLWFSAPTRFNQTLEGEDIRVAKYHEVLNMAIGVRACRQQWMQSCKKGHPENWV